MTSFLRGKCFHNNVLCTLAFVVLGVWAPRALATLIPPTISNVTTTNITATSTTVTWNTDIPADTLVSYSTNGDGFEFDQGRADCGAALTETATSAGCLGTGSSTGVTSHSFTLTGLQPNTGFNYAILSRGFQGGVPDPTLASTSLCGSLCSFTTLPAPASGTLDYFVGLAGTHHVTQGYSSYVNLNMYDLQGTASDTGVLVAFSGLPPGAILDFPDADIHSCAQNYANSSTMSIYQASCPFTYFKITAASTTPAGSYTLTLTVSSKSGTPAVKILTWPMTVDAAAPLASSTPASYPPIPCLDASSTQMDGASPCTWNWTTNMVTYGPEWGIPGVGRDNSGPPNQQSAWYYDGERVYFQIHDYDQAHNLTGNPAQWNTFATNWESSYSAYVTSHQGRVQGYMVFPVGLYMGYIRTGNATDSLNVDQLAARSSFTGLSAPSAGSSNIRETAYLIDADRLANDLGYTAQGPLAEKAVDMELGIVDQDVVSESASYVQPFMLGLAADSLIHYYEDGHTSDVRIPVAIKDAADWLWANAWNKTNGLYSAPNAFYYSENFFKYGESQPPGSDLSNLNLLICPMYAWLYQYTGDATYQVDGDTCWQAGVNDDPANGINWSGKNFSQQYRWSFDYVYWRNDLNVPALPPPSPPIQQSRNGSSSSGSSGSLGNTVTAKAPAPQIKVASSAITATSAKITVTSNIAASVIVDYGPTTAYSYSTAPGSPFLTTIYLNLTDLTPNTVYDYRVVATGQGSGARTAYSPNYAFRTPKGSAASSSPAGGAGTASGSGGSSAPASSSSSTLPFPRTLTAGDTGSDVHLLQVTLQSLGFLTPLLVPTQYFGSLTQHAMYLFQHAHQLNQSGNLDLQSQTLMNKIVSAGVTPRAVPTPVTGARAAAPPSSASLTRTLSLGDTGSDVSLLQAMLFKDGDYPQDLVTGYFGTLTEAAVARFQTKYDIISYGSPTTTGYGLVGPRTRAMLNAVKYYP